MEQRIAWLGLASAFHGWLAWIHAEVGAYMLARPFVGPPALLWARGEGSIYFAATWVLCVVGLEVAIQVPGAAFRSLAAVLMMTVWLAAGYTAFLVVLADALAW